MSRTIRIGILIGYGEPFWLQVHEMIWQYAQTLGVELVEISTKETSTLSEDDQAEVVENLLVQELDVLISNMYPSKLLSAILNSGIPIIYVAEILTRHSRFSAHLGLFDAGYMLGAMLHERLAGCGTVLLVGGLAASEEDSGQSRLNGFFAALPSDHRYAIHHVPSTWSQEHATQELVVYLNEHPALQIDAIFGLSDTIALAARHMCDTRGHMNSATLVLGINGDPLALASITNHTMTATVEIDVNDMAKQAVDLAYRAACGTSVPPYFRSRQNLVTSENVAEVATRKLLNLANLPTRLVEINRRIAHERVVQRETNLEIDQQVGLILDKQHLSRAIIELIRNNYRFDDARFLLWYESSEQLLEVGDKQRAVESVPPHNAVAGPLAYALTHNQIVFIPDTSRSSRFTLDPAWPTMRARVVIPVRLGGQIIGLLDLHRRDVTHYVREELDGLQLLADRLGLSIRNAELYDEALAARTIAEKADRLKTVLLTNVSHELRTPLNVILGYSQTALDMVHTSSTRYDAEFPRYLTHMYASAEHLLHLINDLLDLSRAEIGELDLMPELLDTRHFLETVFETSTAHLRANQRVLWRLHLPNELPALHADPVRLRQIIINLLHNAHKFTEHGQITLGASVVSPYLHLWVADTGAGIQAEVQEHIFEPFISINTTTQRHEGIGLGLSIARRLVSLHRGRMTVESELGNGSTFHIYLPLPVAEGASATGFPEGQRALLFVTEASTPPASVVDFAEQRCLALYVVHPNDEAVDALAKLQPALLVIDLETVFQAQRHVVERMCARAHGAHIPLLVYQQGYDALGDETGNLTGLLLKSLNDNVFNASLDHVRPLAPEGMILVVEDDPHLRALHCQMIAKHFPAYSIRDVGDGAAALEILAVEVPSLIVLDLVMPRVDGFTVLEALHAHPRTASIPVLVLSGKTLSIDDIQRLAAARASYQTKDMLDESEMIASFQRALAREEVLPPHTSAHVKRAIGFIQQHYSEPITLQIVADALGVNRHYLGRIFHQELGLAPWQYLIRYRVLRAKELLRITDRTVAQIATQVGFDTATYFSHIFHREVGCSPRVFRARASPSETRL